MSARQSPDPVHPEDFPCVRCGGPVPMDLHRCPVCDAAVNRCPFCRVPFGAKDFCHGNAKSSTRLGGATVGALEREGVDVEMAQKLWDELGSARVFGGFGEPMTEPRFCDLLIVLQKTELNKSWVQTHLHLFFAPGSPEHIRKAANLSEDEKHRVLEAARVWKRSLGGIAKTIRVRRNSNVSTVMQMIEDKDVDVSGLTLKHQCLNSKSFFIPKSITKADTSAEVARPLCSRS